MLTIWLIRFVALQFPETRMRLRRAVYGMLGDKRQDD